MSQSGISSSDVVCQSRRDACRPCIPSGGTAAIGTATLTETTILLSARLQLDARSLLSRFLSEAFVAVVPFGESHYSVAVDACPRYGKGEHPTSLNFRDCLSYAVAQLAGESLLSTGEDFAKTDIAHP